MRFGFGKRTGKLTSEQRAVLERLARAEIDVDEAEQLLVGGPDVRAEETPEPPRADETEDERKARELVERIAQEVDQG